MNKLKSDLKKLGIKIYRNKKTQASLIKKSDVMKALGANRKSQRILVSSLRDVVDYRSFQMKVLTRLFKEDMKMAKSTEAGLGDKLKNLFKKATLPLLVSFFMIGCGADDYNDQEISKVENKTEQQVNKQLQEHEVECKIEILDGGEGQRWVFTDVADGATQDKLELLFETDYPSESYDENPFEVTKEPESEKLQLLLESIEDNMDKKWGHFEKKYDCTIMEHDEEKDSTTYKGYEKGDTQKKKVKKPATHTPTL